MNIIDNSLYTHNNLLKSKTPTNNQQVLMEEIIERNRQKHKDDISKIGVDIRQPINKYQSITHADIIALEAICSSYDMMLEDCKDLTDVYLNMKQFNKAWRVIWNEVQKRSMKWIRDEWTMIMIIDKHVRNSQRYQYKFRATKLDYERLGNLFE